MMPLIGYEKLFRGNPPTAEDDYLATWTTNPEQWKGISNIFYR
jgi:hypothetical protein